MPTLALLKSLVYFDTGYIADLYEVVTGLSPKTQITKNQGKKAGANIPLFSAEVSSQETRSFSVSSFQMLTEIMSTLNNELELNPSTFQLEMQSKYGWITGNLSVFNVRSSVAKSGTGEDKTLATDNFFHLKISSEIDFALITTPEYFSPGLDAFVKLQDTILKRMSIPVRAYVRVMAAKSHMDQWVAIPLLIFESPRAQ